MPWFWDLVAMSSQIPLSLPNLLNLLTQPFNQIPHRNLTNLNLHAWLLEPQQSRSRVSLRQWQQELRLLREDLPDQSMRQSGPFLQSGASLIRWTSGHPLWSQLLTSLCTSLRTGSYNPAPLMVTGQPLLINWEIPPSTSAKTKISLVSWIVSIETDPKVGGVSPLGTYPWCYTSWLRLHSNLSKRPPWSTLPSRLFSSWPLGQANEEVRFMPGKIRILDTNLIGQRCPCIHHPAFSLRTSWPKKVLKVWPQWLYLPWPQLWIGPSSLTGLSVQSELYATIWTGPQT